MSERRRGQDPDPPAGGGSGTGGDLLPSAHRPCLTRYGPACQNQSPAAPVRPAATGRRPASAAPWFRVIRWNRQRSQDAATGCPARPRQDQARRGDGVPPDQPCPKAQRTGQGLPENPGCASNGRNGLRHPALPGLRGTPLRPAIHPSARQGCLTDRTGPPWGPDLAGHPAAAG